MSNFRRPEVYHAIMVMAGLAFGAGGCSQNKVGICSSTLPEFNGGFVQSAGYGRSSGGWHNETTMLLRLVDGSEVKVVLNRGPGKSPFKSSQRVDLFSINNSTYGYGEGVGTVNKSAWSDDVSGTVRFRQCAPDELCGFVTCSFVNVAHDPELDHTYPDRDPFSLK